MKLKEELKKIIELRTVNENGSQKVDLDLIRVERQDYTNWEQDIEIKKGLVYTLICWFMEGCLMPVKFYREESVELLGAWSSSSERQGINLTQKSRLVC